MSFDLDKSVQAARRLPARQRQVLLHLADGKPRKEIADALKISYSTADNYCSIVFQRLAVHNRVEAARVALAAGLAG